MSGGISGVDGEQCELMIAFLFCMGGSSQWVPFPCHALKLDVWASSVAGDELEEGI